MRICAFVLAASALTGCATRQLRPERSLSGETALVGCLAPGSEPGQYFLTDWKNKDNRTLVVGDPDLALHSQHAVRVIGMLDREVPVRGLKAIRIEHIAASCHAPF